MKIRQGFVSNSSSSSFTCDITGRTECGYDLSMRDAGFYQCAGGHTMDEEHVDAFILDLCKQGKDVVMAAFNDDEKHITDYIEDNYDAQCITREPSTDDLFNLVREALDEVGNGRWELPTGLCPVCQLAYVNQHDVLRYLLAVCHCTYIDVCKAIKQKFGDDTDKFYETISHVTL
jgi:hypothetical protein